MSVPARRGSVELDDAFQSAVEHAIRCGELLIEAKAALPHGSWGDWISENFPASNRTAQGYMRLARAEDAQALAHLGIEGALKELAAPKPEEERPEDLPPEPKREDYGEGPFEEGRFMFAKARHADDRLIAHYRKVMADAEDLIAADPVAGSAFVAKAATGIEFMTAQHEQEQTGGNLEWAEAFKKAGEAWRIHRQARDAFYAAIGEPLMDERPVNFFDAVYVFGEETTS